MLPGSSAGVAARPLPGWVRETAAGVDLEALCERVVVRDISVAFPDLAGDDGFADHLRASVRENLSLLQQVLTGRLPLAAVRLEQPLAFARVQAELRIPQTALQRSYRVGFAIMWEAWAEQLQVAAEASDVPARGSGPGPRRADRGHLRVPGPRRLAGRGELRPGRRRPEPVAGLGPAGAGARDPAGGPDVAGPVGPDHAGPRPRRPPRRGGAAGRGRGSRRPARHRPACRDRGAAEPGPPARPHPDGDLAHHPGRLDPRHAAPADRRAHRGPASRRRSASRCAGWRDSGRPWSRRRTWSGCAGRGAAPNPPASWRTRTSRWRSCCCATPTAPAGSSARSSARSPRTPRRPRGCARPWRRRSGWAATSRRPSTCSCTSTPCATGCTAPRSTSGARCPSGGPSSRWRCGCSGCSAGGD